MKRYVNYIDTIKAPDSLTERLRGLKAKKRPSHALRWAGIAAALALIVGIGIALRHTPAEPVKDPEIVGPGIDPDGGPYVPGGGYDIADGDSVSHYFLPALRFADASALPRSDADYALDTPDGYNRALEAEDLELIFDTDRYLEHLGWPEDADLGGAVYFAVDGTAHGMSLSLSADGQGSEYIEILRDHDVPSCCVPPREYFGVTDVDGEKVRVLVMDGECEVKLFVNGFGYKATIRGDNYQDSAARFVRLVLASRRGLTDVRYE